MAVFSVNQNRQLYVANAHKATVAGTDPAGTISVKADKAKKCFYFSRSEEHTSELQSQR